MKLTKLFFLVLALTSTALFATTFTNPGVIELGDAPGPDSVICHDGDIVILHKGDHLSIQASTILSSDTSPSKEFSFYFDTDEYLTRNPSPWASEDAGIFGNFFFSRILVLAQNIGKTKLFCDTITGEGDNMDIKRETIIIDVQL